MFLTELVSDILVLYVCGVFFASRTTVLHSMRLGIDVNRHKEIIVKAISALLLLLLKYFKLNHVYQVILHLTV
jgi:hypothetical protein